MELRGESIIGFKRIEASGGEEIFGINPATGEKLGPPYRAATAAQVDQAAQLAARAFQRYGTLTRPAEGSLPARDRDQDSIARV